MTQRATTVPGGLAEAHRKTIGILGGMGPAATVDLMRRVIALTPATDDADHIRMLVDCNPAVPSRIAALIDGTGPSPAPTLIAMARGLAKLGADMLAIPCNTAHHYLGDIRGAVSIPVLSMIDLSAETIALAHPGVAYAGLMASTAVRLTGVYENALTARGIKPLYPSPRAQQAVMDIIMAVKAGRTESLPGSALNDVLSDLQEAGAGCILVACTELSLLGVTGTDLPLHDASEILARSIVATALVHADRRAHPQQTLT